MCIWSSKIGRFGNERTFGFTGLVTGSICYIGLNTQLVCATQLMLDSGVFLLLSSRLTSSLSASRTCICSSMSQCIYVGTYMDGVYGVGFRDQGLRFGLSTLHWNWTAQASLSPEVSFRRSDTLEPRAETLTPAHCQGSAQETARVAQLLNDAVQDPHA